MQILGDLNRCIGAGQCVMLAPDLFTQDEETGLVVVMVPSPTAAQLAAAQAAETACPALAIQVKDIGEARAG